MKNILSSPKGKLCRLKVISECRDDHQILKFGMGFDWIIVSTIIAGKCHGYLLLRMIMRQYVGYFGISVKHHFL